MWVTTQGLCDLMIKGCVHGTVTLDTIVLLKGPCILNSPVFCSVWNDILSSEKGMAAASNVSQDLQTLLFVTYSSWVAEGKQLSGRSSASVVGQ